MTPLQLFRKGMDTMDIAAHLNRAEAEIEKLIHIERSHETRKWARFEKREALK